MGVSLKGRQLFGWETEFAVPKMPWELSHSLGTGLDIVFSVITSERHSAVGRAIRLEGPLVMDVCVDG